MLNCAENAKALTDGIASIGKFKILSKPVGVPVCAFCLKDNSKYTEGELAGELRRYGWILPSYTMAPDAQNVTLLRVVVREDFSHGLVDRLVGDIKRVLEKLESQPSKPVQRVADAIKHDDAAAPEHVKQHGESHGQKQGHGGSDPNSKHVSVFSDEHNNRGHFNVNKKHGLRKTNGVC